MSSVRNIANGGAPSWFSTYTAKITGYVWTAAEWGKSFWSLGRYVGWFIVTAGLMTALPLVLELRREAVFDEFEKLQVSQGIAEGRTPQELAAQGMSSAIEPKVLD